MAQAKMMLSKKQIGYLMYATALIMPLSNYPQIYQLYKTHVTSGLSLSTWCMYLVFSLIPIYYAIVNRLRPLLVSNLLWMIVYIVMIFGILRFGWVTQSGSYERLLLINNAGKAMSGLGLLCITASLALYAHDLITNHD